MLTPVVTSAAIITTDKCSAACEECCFLCNPKNKNMLTLDKMKTFIDDIEKNLKTVQLIVFTGGEATLLGSNLFAAIKYANSKNFSTRIVTNGWWAKNEKQAVRMVDKFIQAGLTEINFSTGDNHQQWIDLNTIINACYASTTRGLLTVVNIEAFDKAKFTINDFFENERIKLLYSQLEDEKLLQVISSPWVSINEQKNFTHCDININNDVEGCDSILNYVGLNEQGEISACCGLTQRKISEMNLSKMYPNNSIKSMLNKQNKDLLKIWIWVDGPKTIYDTLLKFNSTLKRNVKFVHVCEYCAALYNNDEIKKTLLNYLTEKRILEILNKYHLKMYYQNEIIAKQGGNKK
ncbi:hypothetical protein PFZ79_002426 [Enterococcus hirae]|nr:hypothetical protein [Enterococcus hirae]